LARRQSWVIRLHSDGLIPQLNALVLDWEIVALVDRAKLTRNRGTGSAVPCREGDGVIGNAGGGKSQTGEDSRDGGEMHVESLVANKSGV
jgi:hypothetical protein